jgi:ammonia channel protein AmtB
LRKIRKLIRKAGSDNDFYSIDNGKMVLGTVIIVIGWCMLNSCGSGGHNITSVGGRYSVELAYMNTLISGSFSSMTSFLLKRHIVRGDNAKT